MSTRIHPRRAGRIARSQAASAQLRIPAAPAGVGPLWAESVPAAPTPPACWAAAPPAAGQILTAAPAPPLLLFRADAPWDG